MTLTEFLLARIAEDEARVDGIHQGSDPDFFWGPDRIRAECERDRRIVELHDRAHHQCVSDDEDGPSTLWRTYANPCDTIRLLASSYADHPDYRSEWKP